MVALLNIVNGLVARFQDFFFDVVKVLLALLELARSPCD
jgi:hypothetical protein